MRHALFIAAAMCIICAMARDEVFVMTSKGVYETSEDLWFKAYVLDNRSHTLSDSNHILYMNIYAPGDSAVWSGKFPIYNGRADGHVYIGDLWPSGEYTLSAICRNSFSGDSSEAVAPRRIIIVNNLPELDSIYTHLSADSSYCNSTESPLRIKMRTDSSGYNTGSKIKLEIAVADSAGKPVQAELALSCFDWLYHNPFGYEDIVSHYAATASLPESTGNSFLPDAYEADLTIGNKKKAKKLSEVGEQYVNVFEPDGVSNIIASDNNGLLSIDRDLLVTLPRHFFMKPLSGQELKLKIKPRDCADRVAQLMKSKPRLQSFTKLKLPCENADTVPQHHGMRTYHLDDVEVTAKVRYPKRDKFYGYLDSISALFGSAWVCGCESGTSGGFLNDYVDGYTHHPHWNTTASQPKEHSRPVKGKEYLLIKYLPGGPRGQGYVADMKYMTWTGEEYSEEELLAKNGLTKGLGLEPRFDFQHPTAEDVASGLFANRNTLLWLPSLLTDENGRATIEFYASDINTLYYIVVNALDGRGGIGSAATQILVGE